MTGTSRTLEVAFVFVTVCNLNIKEEKRNL